MIAENNRRRNDQPEKIGSILDRVIEDLREKCGDSHENELENDFSAAGVLNDD